MKRRGVKTGMADRVRSALLRHPGNLSCYYAQVLGEDAAAVRKVLCVLGKEGECYRDGPAVLHGHGLSQRWYPVAARDSHPLAVAWGMR